MQAPSCRGVGGGTPAIPNFSHNPAIPGRFRRPGLGATHCSSLPGALTRGRASARPPSPAPDGRRCPDCPGARLSRQAGVWGHLGLDRSAAHGLNLSEEDPEIGSPGKMSAHSWALGSWVSRQTSKPQRVLQLEAEARPRLVLWVRFNCAAWRASDLPNLGHARRRIWSC